MARSSGNEPAHLEKHVVVPHEKQRGPRFAEAAVIASHLVHVVLVDPAEKSLPPWRAFDLAQVVGRPVLAAIFDDDELDGLVARVPLPALEASPQDGEVVEGRNDDGQLGYSHDLSDRPFGDLLLDPGNHLFEHRREGGRRLEAEDLRRLPHVRHAALNVVLERLVADRAEGPRSLVNLRPRWPSPGRGPSSTRRSTR